MTRTDDGELLRRAAELHKAILTLDGHLDVLVGPDAPDLATDTGDRSQFDLVKARQGGIDAAVLTIHAPAARADEAGIASGRAELEARYRLVTDLVAGHPEVAAVADGPDSLRRHVAQGQFAVVLGFQNAAALAGGLPELESWVDRGVQVFGFAFIGNNLWADSARPYPYVLPSSAGGLTALGREGVQLLNRHGVIVDVSQLSSSALADVLMTTEAPVLASHSALRHFRDIDRNLADDELAALRDNGGLVQVVGFAPYLRPTAPLIQDRVEGLWCRYGLEVTGRPSDLVSVNDPITATWDDETFWTFLHEFHVLLELDRPVETTVDLVDHIERAVDHLGIEHVGISSDFNHGGGLADWRHTGESLNVTAELLRRGFGEQDLRALWAENFLNLWEKVRRHGQ